MSSLMSFGPQVVNLWPLQHQLKRKHKTHAYSMKYLLLLKLHGIESAGDITLFLTGT